jgi:uncharacterized protein (DUF486 family)
MLIASNVFMTFAWYGHLKGKSLTLPLAILSSWLIALPEYMLAVPANRMGINVYSTAQLKTGQEAITLIVFTLFSYFYLGEALKWTTFLGFRADRGRRGAGVLLQVARQRITSP